MDPAQIFEFVQGGGSTAILCLVVWQLFRLYKEERQGRIDDAKQCAEADQELAKQLAVLSERINRGGGT